MSDLHVYYQKGVKRITLDAYTSWRAKSKVAYSSTVLQTLRDGIRDDLLDTFPDSTEPVNSSLVGGWSLLSKNRKRRLKEKYELRVVPTNKPTDFVRAFNSFMRELAELYAMTPLGGFYSPEDAEGMDTKGKLIFADRRSREGGEELELYGEGPIPPYDGSRASTAAYLRTNASELDDDQSETSSTVTVPIASGSGSSGVSLRRQQSVGNLLGVGSGGNNDESGDERSDTADDDLYDAIVNAFDQLGVTNDFFEYNGFDAKKCTEHMVNLAKRAPSVTMPIDGREFHFHGDYYANDLAILTATALCRGNNITNIVKKSNPEFSKLLANLQQTFQITAAKPTTSTQVTLMRAVACFPSVAYHILGAGVGRNMVPHITTNLVLSHPVSFQMVSRASFSRYAFHFLYVAQGVDMVINPKESKRTELRSLWNFMVIAFSSDTVPEGKRRENIGVPVDTDWNRIIGPADTKTALELKVRNNDPSQI